ncbi:hypothetical protein [Amycolatopsis sp. Hca4]|uniref:hypothetical protein n=1 Tax=Amycolatopsis sp. Hca4 TaxID=2742131 RepID=UPI001590AE7F|nr:hypothetical protein [Amycolatopsis sp. Hca4]QKV74052.1 hypothetical protein HUT10_09920 [Amycolatopsis sp. Hca4]
MSSRVKHSLQTTTASPAAHTAALQRQALAPAVHSGVAPIENLSSGLVRMPAFHRAVAHVHVRSEVVIFTAAGYAASLVGEELEHTFVHAPHSIMMIGAGVPHLGLNLSGEVVLAFEARTDPAFNEDVELLPHLDELASARALQVQEEFRRGLFAEALKEPSWSTAVRSPGCR